MQAGVIFLAVASLREDRFNFAGFCASLQNGTISIRLLSVAGLIFPQKQLMVFSIFPKTNETHYPEYLL
jgi:hypothetical protein